MRKEYLIYAIKKEAGISEEFMSAAKKLLKKNKVGNILEKNKFLNKLNEPNFYAKKLKGGNEFLDKLNEPNFYAKKLKGGNEYNL